tara:strand:+ start:1009 stop:1302 length:294 start_codon:yes stop_codon:yes gene_type:complete
VNGKGDKWRGGWSQEYASNHNKIFGGNMSLVDNRGTKLSVGERVCVQVDIPSHDGVLYKNTIVKLDEINNNTKKIRVTDRAGKIWWIEPNQVSCSFL